MSSLDAHDVAAMLTRIRRLAAAGQVRITVHAQDEMDAERITSDELLAILATGEMLENYPTYHKGACCLVCGQTLDGCPLHIVCSTTRPVLVIITAYEPMLPWWVTPTQRGERNA